MPFNGSGVYALPSTTVTPAVSGTTIDSSEFNTFTADLETALTLCVAKDGQTSSPILTNPKILTKILDTNSNELLEFGTTGSAVNHVKVINAATGTVPTIQTAGEADIGLDFENSEGEEILQLVATPTAVNNVVITNATTGNAATISTSETNTDLALAGNGTGGVYGTITTHTSSPFATTSGSSVDVTGIPSWVKRITISFNGLSSDGSSGEFRVLLGDSGGLETSGYQSTTTIVNGANTCSVVTDSTLILLNDSTTHVDTSSYSGHLVITLVDGTNFDYAYSGVVSDYRAVGTSGSSATISGSKSLTTVLTQFRVLVSAGGSFDAGEFSVHYEG